jgi:protein-disulfide isomerase
MMGKSTEAKKIKKQQRHVEIEKRRKTQKLMGWTLAFVLLACIGFIVSKAAFGTGEDKPVDTKAFQYEKQPAMGSKDAPVKIVEFFDFKCPSCKEFDATILPQLKKDFIDQGIVEFYSINYPIISPGADSTTAAIAGEAIYRQNPEEFWKFYEAVYKQQGDERTKWATSDALVEIAKQANLKVDLAQLKKDIDNKTYAEDVKEDEAIGNKFGVTGDPTIFINGTEVSENDTFNYESIKKAISSAKGDTSK